MEMSACAPFSALSNPILFTLSVCSAARRWDVDGTSIFSVGQAKEMAQTPQRLPTAFEAKRMSKIQTAAYDSPLVQGYRLLPQFTPGRALMWGSILAVWGTAAVAMGTARHLDIHTVRCGQPMLPCMLAELARQAGAVAHRQGMQIAAPVLLLGQVRLTLSHENLQ